MLFHLIFSFSYHHIMHYVLTWRVTIKYTLQVIVSLSSPGPVVSMIPFKTEEEVIEMANSTKYGLSASIFTRDISRAHRVAAAIDSGVVWINTWMLRDLRIPFGGMKSSGVGREGGFKSLQFFTEPKNVCIKI